MQLLLGAAPELSARGVQTGLGGGFHRHGGPRPGLQQGGWHPEESKGLQEGPGGRPSRERRSDLSEEVRLTTGDGFGVRGAAGASTKLVEVDLGV